MNKTILSILIIIILLLVGSFVSIGQTPQTSCAHANKVVSGAVEVSRKTLDSPMDSVHLHGPNKSGSGASSPDNVKLEIKKLRTKFTPAFSGNLKLGSISDYGILFGVTFNEVTNVDFLEEFTVQPPGECECFRRLYFVDVVNYYKIFTCSACSSEVVTNYTADSTSNYEKREVPVLSPICTISGCEE